MFLAKLRSTLLSALLLTISHGLTPAEAMSLPSFQDWAEVPGHRVTASADATVAFNGKLYVFGIGIDDHQHYVNTFDGLTWSGWSAVPGGGTTLVSDAAVV